MHTFDGLSSFCLSKCRSTEDNGAFPFSDLPIISSWLVSSKLLNTNIPLKPLYHIIYPVLTIIWLLVIYQGLVIFWVLHVSTSWKPVDVEDYLLNTFVMFKDACQTLYMSLNPKREHLSPWVSFGNSMEIPIGTSH